MSFANVDFVACLQEFEKRGVAVVFGADYPLVLRAVDDWRLVVTPDFGRFVLMRRLKSGKGWQANLWARDLGTVLRRLTGQRFACSSVVLDGLPLLPADYRGLFNG